MLLVLFLAPLPFPPPLPANAYFQCRCSSLWLSQERSKKGRKEQSLLHLHKRDTKERVILRDSITITMENISFLHLWALDNVASSASI